jgi:ribosomal protein S4
MKYISGIALMSMILLTIACSGASEVTNKNTSVNNSLYPAWYGSYEFSSDSTNFYARATAVASDSKKAELRAEKEARALLESYIAKELEDVRKELSRDGSGVVKEPNFILMLRNAHYKIEEQATVNDLESAMKEGVYRGFAKVEISKQQVRQLIESGLSMNIAFQREFVGSQSFKDFVHK